MLTISVKNFGPIAEGSVDLKPLTIFVGPSNTGKSYMATAVYAVMRAVSHMVPPKVRNNFFERAVWFRFSAIPEFDGSVETLRALQDWVYQQARESSNLSGMRVSSLPLEFRSWMEKETELQLYNLQNNVIHQLQQIHGESSEFVKRGNDPNHFTLGIRQDFPVLDMEIRLPDSLGPQPGFEIGQFILPDSALSNLQLDFFAADGRSRVWAELARSFVNSVSEKIVDDIPSQSCYLPSARSGIVQGHKVLSGALIRQSSLVGIRQLNVPTLPGITTEFLSHLISFDRRTITMKGKGDIDRSTTFIETEVLQGRIDLDESAGLPYPEIVYETDTGQFPIDQTSSMVSELAPLILFLKYLIDEGDLLILEEPESHLHPAAQRRLARGIVRLVNAGVKVLITTHSDIIISQVNNLLALRQASPELVEQGGFEPDDFLQPEQVGAYLFRYNPELSGCDTVPLEIDPDTGIDEDEFAAVFEAIYNESIALQRDRN